MIRKLSASQIESFDSNTTFGCERKWWFERVGGRAVAKDAALSLGDAVHQTLETFLRGGAQGGLHDLVIGAPGALEYLIGLRKRVEHVEVNFDDLILAGVPIVGKIDWTAANPEGRELGDHKTTSAIAKYAKTPGQLKSSVQMNIYAKRFYSKGLDISRLTQDFYQTRGPKKFDVVTVEYSKRENDSRILSIESTVEEMKKASELTKPEDLKPNLNACNIGYGCPHRDYCKRSGEFNMASLLEAFSPKVAETPAAVLPPDAPASQPALASSPPPASVVEKEIEAAVAEQEVEAPKAGRPKGAKNRPKEFVNAPAVASFVPSMGPVTITKISIRHGAKIGMPNYSSATVEVEAEGTPTGSVEDAKASLSLQVQAMMLKELEIYTAKKDPVKP